MRMMFHAPLATAASAVAMLATFALPATAAGPPAGAVPVAGGLAVAAVVAGAATAQAPADSRSERKREAESQRAWLQERLGALKKSIGNTETAKNRAVDALSRSDLAISDTTRALHDLERDQAEAQAELAALDRQRAVLIAGLAARRTQLAALLRQHYVAGDDDRIKLLLSGEDPARIGRQLRYLGYVERAQAELIAALQTSAAAVETNRTQAVATNAELEGIAAATLAQEGRLQQERRLHGALVARLSTDLARQRAETGRLQRDDNRLGSVVEQLGKLIEQQRIADEAAREKRRRDALARAAAQAKAQAESDARALALAKAQAQAAARAKSGVPPKVAGLPITRPAPGIPAKAAREALGKPLPEMATTNPDAIDADEPARARSSKTVPSTELGAEESIQGVISGQAFARLRGRLSLPVRGEVSGRFGAPREGGPGAKGIFIRAVEGAQVHAVAAGRVMFAEWLRGFGNLVIIDHGGQYLTVYGNNQAVLKHAGDRVAAGEVIASAGSTGGHEQSGLYFEMRYQGRPIDPLGWTAR